ncbi:hypothetical protein BGLA2_200031 [Burkholderia gladioli]|nr:hypothetical protein BGLA2_200031 [Burkholderia gladioli]
MISPGFHSPDSSPWVINALICWYKGLKVGDGACAGVGSPPAEAWPAAFGFDAFAWLDVMARISTQSQVFRPHFSSNTLSYIRHKIPFDFAIARSYTPGRARKRPRNAPDPRPAWLPGRSPGAGPSRTRLLRTASMQCDA